VKAGGDKSHKKAIIAGVNLSRRGVRKEIRVKSSTSRWISGEKEV